MLTTNTIEKKHVTLKEKIKLQKGNLCNSCGNSGQQLNH